jgi:hypothetical protein
MNIPANIRVNATFPFPSLVNANGPIYILKANGIWTLKYDISQIPVAVPPPGAFPTDYVLVWDSILNTFVSVTLQTLFAGAAGVALANPTALIGPAAVNGIASTAMRSDAAPALNPNLTMTWNVVQNFNGGIALPAPQKVSIGGQFAVSGGPAAFDHNWFFGPAGNGTVTGQGNTAVGDSCALGLTTGQFNTAIGFFSLPANTTGGQNLAIGFEALFRNTTGSGNIAIGQCMAHCLTGNNNIAIGQNALDAFTDNGSFGGAHIAIGNQSMQSYVDTSPINANRNTAVGNSALQALGLGGNNTAIGFEALLFIGRNDHSVTVNFNTGLGSLAGCYNTDGLDSTFIGAFCGFGNNRADNPTFGSNTMARVTGVGSHALLALGNSADIVAIGYQAGADMTDGANGNTMVGANTGRGITTGINNTIIGRVTGLSAALSASIILADGNNNIRLDYGKTNASTWTLGAPIATPGFTVAGLPAAGIVGRRAHVTDQNGAPTFLGALTGGGAIKCPVFDNGVAWVAG